LAFCVGGVGWNAWLDSPSQKSKQCRFLFKTWSLAWSSYDPVSWRLDVVTCCVMLQDIDRWMMGWWNDGWIDGWMDKWILDRWIDGYIFTIIY
jgi:hypothetical protein